MSLFSQHEKVVYLTVYSYLLKTVINIIVWLHFIVTVSAET